jgi:hypothetical protein
MPPGVGRKEREKREGRGESRFLYNTYYMAMYFINSQQADGSLAGWMDGYSNIGERVSEEMPFGTGHGLERRMRKSSWRGIALFCSQHSKD